MKLFSMPAVKILTRENVVVKLIRRAGNTRMPMSPPIEVQVIILFKITTNMKGNTRRRTIKTAGSGSASSRTRSTKNARLAPQLKLRRETIVESWISQGKWPVERPITICWTDWGPKQAVVSCVDGVQRFTKDMDQDGAVLFMGWVTVDNPLLLQLM